MADDSLHDHPGPVVDETAMATLEVLDDGTLDWGRVTKTTFLAHHVLRYFYRARSRPCATGSWSSPRPASPTSA